MSGRLLWSLIGRRAGFLLLTLRFCPLCRRSLRASSQDRSLITRSRKLDLSTFIHNWESVIAGLNHQPAETTLRDILLREHRGSTKLKFDLEVYDRAKEGDEKHTYDYLVKWVKELMTRERTRRNRAAIAKAPQPLMILPQIRTLPEVVSKRNPALHSNCGKCPKGNKCRFEHVKVDQSRGRTLPRSPKGGRGGSAGSGKGGGKSKDKSKIPCMFYPKLTSKNRKNCPFLHKDASPSVPAKGDKDGRQRAPSPAKPRRPSKKRGKSADNKAACCLASNASLACAPELSCVAARRVRPVLEIIGLLMRTRAFVFAYIRRSGPISMSLNLIIVPCHFGE